MKKIVALLLGVMLAVGVVGCGDKKDKEGKKETGRLLYNNVKLEKYIELGKYEGMEIDTSSDEFKEAYQAVLDNDVAENNLYVRKTEGKVAKGDTANIDYIGKKDGVAFSGGTAEGYDLEIGSGSFIDGFEDGLIGVTVGSTVDLNLTFPENYDNEELAGQAVVFTVTVNYVKTEEKLPAEEYYKQLGFSSVDAYYDDAKKRTIKDSLITEIVEISKINKYPQKELKKLTESGIEQYDSMISAQTGLNLETYLQYVGSTMDDFKDDLVQNYVKPMMDTQMVMYAILDKEGFKLTEKEVDKKIDEILKSYGSSVDKEILVNYYGDYYFENLVVSEKVADYIYNKSIIK